MSAKGSRLLAIGALVVLWLAGCGVAPSNSELEGDDSGNAVILVNGCNINGTPFGGGSGSPGSPYLLCAAKHLRSLNERPDQVLFFKMTTDIVIPSGTSVGSNENFKGDLDGAGHYIAGLTGLPFITTNSGRIHHLEMRDIALAGSYRLGGIAGTNDLSGVIEHCKTSGTIRAPYTVGGIVGFNDGEVFASSSSVAIQVTNRGGGIAGVNRGVIERSSSAGSVVASDVISGGFVGEQLGGGAISDSFSHTTVRGRVKVASFVSVNDGTVARSYADGAVTITGADLNKSGGLVGGGSGGVAASFWDTQKTGMSTSNGGSGVTSAQLESAATFAGWDFLAVWSLEASGGPPIFRQ